jgi:hypothetical protein
MVLLSKRNPRCTRPYETPLDYEDPVSPEGAFPDPDSVEGTFPDPDSVEGEVPEKHPDDESDPPWDED